VVKETRTIFERIIRMGCMSFSWSLWMCPLYDMATILFIGQNFSPCPFETMIQGALNLLLVLNFKKIHKVEFNSKFDEMSAIGFLTHSTI